MNADGGSEWRFSVRVNTAAGHRSADIFGTAAKTEDSTTADSKLEKGYVRVLREPGGGGNAAYDCLYNNTGNDNVHATQTDEAGEDVADGDEDTDVEMAEDHSESTSVGDGSQGKISPCDDESDADQAQHDASLPKRVELPDAHPFFAANDSQPGDRAILTRVIEGVCLRLRWSILMGSRVY